MKIIQNKIDHLKASSSIDVYDLIKKRDKYHNNSEFRAAKAIGLQNFDDDGYLNLETKSSSSSIKEDLVPFYQAYRSPFLQFGY